MKEKDLVFFGAEGLTSASAAHICTLCAEKARVLASYVENVSLVNKDLEIPASGTSTRLHNGIGDEELLHLHETLDKIGDYHSLQAWLTEAIKAKQRATDELGKVDFVKWKEVCNIDEDECPEFHSELVSPADNTAVNSDEILASWSVKDRMRILELGSRAAIYGKYIGIEKTSIGTVKGAYAKAREEYFSRHQSPVDVKGEGQDVTITRYSESVSQSVEDQVFFSMEQKHRSLNAELNGLLHRLEEEVNSEAARRRMEYIKARAEYDAAYAVEHDEFTKKLTQWNIRRKELTIQWQEWKRVRLDELQRLRIVIPNAMKDTYISLNSLEKC